MNSERRPPSILSWLTSASFGAMAVYWGYVALNASSVSDTATGQVFDIDFKRHRPGQGAYATWPQLETMILLGLVALIFAASWSFQKSRLDRRDR